MSNITVKQAMDELKSRSGYSFVFSSADVDTGKKISVSSENQSINAVIEQILRGQGRRMRPRKEYYLEEGYLNLCR